MSMDILELLAARRSFLRMCPNFLFLLTLGRCMCTLALRPVPRLDGQVLIKPKCSLHMNSLPFVSNEKNERERENSKSKGIVAVRFQCATTVDACIPCFLIASSTFLSPVQNLVKTSFMLPPFCMEMTRVWSSSLISGGR